MSVTFIDLPGPLMNTSEPIDFTTTKPVLSISIEFNPHLGNGSRETVWDGTDDTGLAGGDFSYAYSASTHTNDRLTWHIARRSTWPAELRIRIIEVPTSGVQMETSRVTLETGSNYDVATTPEVGQLVALTWACVGGTVFNGLKAPTDQSKAHYVRVINNSGFAVTLKNEDSGNAFTNSMFFTFNDSDLTWSDTRAYDFVWMPGSISPTGTSRWFIFRAG